MHNSLGAVSGAIIVGAIVGTGVAIENSSRTKFIFDGAHQKKQEPVGEERSGCQLASFFFILL